MRLIHYVRLYTLFINYIKHVSLGIFLIFLHFQVVSLMYKLFYVILNLHNCSATYSIVIPTLCPISAPLHLVLSLSPICMGKWYNCEI